MRACCGTAPVDLTSEKFQSSPQFPRAPPGALESSSCTPWELSSVPRSASLRTREGLKGARAPRIASLCSRPPPQADLGPQALPLRALVLQGKQRDPPSQAGATAAPAPAEAARRGTLRSPPHRLLAALGTGVGDRVRGLWGGPACPLPAAGVAVQTEHRIQRGRRER